METLNSIATGIGYAVISLCFVGIVVEGYSKIREIIKKYSKCS